MNRPHASQEDLLAFALDQTSLSPAIRQHLERCPLCQQQVTRYQQATAYLLSGLYRSQCPSGAILSYYCLPGVLSNAEHNQVSAHLAHCPLCTSEITETLQFLET